MFIVFDRRIIRTGIQFLGWIWFQISEGFCFVRLAEVLVENQAHLWEASSENPNRLQNILEKKREWCLSLSGIQRVLIPALLLVAVLGLWKSLNRARDLDFEAVEIVGLATLVLPHTASYRDQVTVLQHKRCIVPNTRSFVYFISLHLASLLCKSSFGTLVMHVKWLIWTLQVDFKIMGGFTDLMRLGSLCTSFHTCLVQRGRFTTTLHIAERCHVHGFLPTTWY